MRTFNLIDTLIIEADHAIRALIPPIKRISTRLSPASPLPESALTINEKKHIAGLMRVNHAGEVCAQALYQGQALTAQLTHVKKQMNEAAMEEIDHLAWCEQRLNELNSHPSVFNPLWYAGSLILGAIAGLAGDNISLGFVAETERQVTSHLQKHLQDIPAGDVKTVAILQRMQEDEEYHALTAVKAGATELPFIIKRGMTLVAKIMTKTSYYI